LDPVSSLLLVLLIGFAAQLVDGSLGMGYGVTSATLLATIGFSPAVASATIHVAKIGTGIMSGTAHWRFGNVHWRAVFMLAVPGTVGAFIGAIAVSHVDAAVAAPWVSLILTVLGLVVLSRTLLGRAPTIRLYSPRFRTLGPLGAVGGFVDSVGGGGWGPVTTSTLMAANHLSPNQVIGTVSMSEFIVAIGATVGFLLALGSAGVDWAAAVALLVGGIVAAPIAAWLVSRLDHRVLGGLVGGMILFYNAERVLGLVGISGWAVIAVRIGIVVATAAICVFAWRRRGRTAAEPGVEAEPAPEEAPTARPAPVTEPVGTTSPMALRPQGDP
jgi:hypothetical protein